MFARFLHRPALAIVISLLILFLGGLSIATLPISQFPSIAPPRVVIFVAYPGASAEVLTNSVLIPLESSINGVQDMRYIASDATSAGEATIQVYFEPGTDPNQAIVNVQNRIALVRNRLPELVQREGIIVSRARPSMLMYVNVYSTDENADQKFLYNYTAVNILPVIKRIQGVATATILGSRQYAMRIWLDIDRMRAYKISSEDVMEALEEQSVIGSPGRLGRASGKESQSLEYVLTYQGRYNKPEQYENIILKANPEGEILRLRDVAEVELGSEFYDIYSDIDGNPSAAIVLKQSPGSNASDVIERVKEELEEIRAEAFPPGMKYEVTYDVSNFLDASIEKVIHTLIEAFLLVALVVFLFLGDFRSTLIPSLAVPVSLIGTFFVMLMFGLSINLITLFALVLAIGIVVDDAIVVVEAVHAKMHEKHLSPYRATVDVVHEISGAIIAITLVMTAVFVPVAFMTGPVGTFYRQFAITMASAIIISGIVALTLTPVLCAMILKPHGSSQSEQRGSLAKFAGVLHRGTEKVGGRFGWILRYLIIVVFAGTLGFVFYYLITDSALAELLHEVLASESEGGGLVITDSMAVVVSVALALIVAVKLRSWLSLGDTQHEPRRGPLGIFLHLFDRGVEYVTAGYAVIVRRLAPLRLLTLVVVAFFLFSIYAVNRDLPSGFIPNEDQGMLYAIIQTPAGSTLEYTNAKAHELQAVCETIDAITSVSALAGYEVLTEGRGSNAGTCIINLKPWSERELTSREIVEVLEEKCKVLSNVKLEFFEPPAVPGYGAAGGFSLRLLDKTNTGDYEALGDVNETFMAALRQRPELKGLFTFFTDDYPQYELVIDNDVAMQKGVSIGRALDNLSILIGSTYEQGFIRFNRFYKVYVQAAPEFRRMPDDLQNIFVKNEEGEMVPYSAFMTIKKKQGLNEITRYNLYPSSAIQGKPAKGYSSGQAIAAIQEVAAEVLPRGYDIGWGGLAYDEASKGNLALYIFMIVVVFVYLVLVGQYESFLLPLAVIISLPIGIFGSFYFLLVMGLANDVYAQIGLIMLVGLLGKNAILIIEFAVQRRHQGLSLHEAAVEGGRVRFRPIMMTSFAFIAGLLPLVFATGPGAIGNRTIGTAAAGGMMVGTLVGVFVIPGLYYLFGKISEMGDLIRDESDEPLSELFERQT